MRPPAPLLQSAPRSGEAKATLRIVPAPPAAPAWLRARALAVALNGSSDFASALPPAAGAMGGAGCRAAAENVSVLRCVGAASGAAAESASAEAAELASATGAGGEAAGTAASGSSFFKSFRARSDAFCFARPAGAAGGGGSSACATSESVAREFAAGELVGAKFVSRAAGAALGRILGTTV
jgi:hypothetical protein